MLWLGRQTQGTMFSGDRPLSVEWLIRDGAHCRKTIEVTDESAMTDMRKAVRPVLVASERTATEETTFLRRLLVGLADESLPVALVCPPGCDIERLVPAPVELLAHPLVDLPLARGLGTEQVAESLAKFKPTVVHCLCESSAATARRLSRRLDVPYVLSIHSLIGPFSRLPVSPRRCTKIIAPAETIRLSLGKTHPALADRAVTIDVGTFVEGGWLCFSDPTRVPSMVVAHPLDRVDDLRNFLLAVKALVAEGRDFVVILMGRGRAEHRLWQFLAAEGLSEVVTIVPPMNPWRSVLAAGDIFVRPQPIPRFSMFLLEAMSAGTAVAACRGGVDDLIVPEETALVFDADDEVSIREVLARFLDDTESARQLAARAQAHLRAKHSVSRMVGAYLETYCQAQQRYVKEATPV